MSAKRRAVGGITPADVADGLAIALLLRQAAVQAVAGRVSLRSYLRIAESLYFDVGGRRDPGGKPSPVDAWTPLVRACGGVGALAEEIGTTRRTLARWRSGATTPSEDDCARVLVLCAERGVTSPFARG